MKVRTILAATAASASVLVASAVLAPAASAQTATAVASGSEAEKLAPGDFNSTFNANKAGWSGVSGAWYLQAGKLHSEGLPGKWTSVKHTNAYGDFVYQAKMRRQGSSQGQWANNLTIRGNPNSLDLDGHWQPSYIFQYSNNGYFSVWRISPAGVPTPIVNWTLTPAVIKGGKYNTLKVVASGNFFSYSINGRQVWSGFDNEIAFGKVGISYYTTVGATSQMDVDWAKLQTIAGRVAADPAAEVGTPVPGGSVDQAPAG